MYNASNLVCCQSCMCIPNLSTTKARLNENGDSARARIHCSTLKNKWKIYNGLDVCVLAQQQQQRLETMHKAFLESLHLSQLFFISFLHFPSGLTALPLEKNIELIKRHLLSSSVVVVVVY